MIKTLLVILLLGLSICEDCSNFNGDMGCKSGS
jgi:hypothetical protein